MILSKNSTVIGFIAGLVVATGGAIKDAPYEGFDMNKFIRSPIVGTIWGSIIGSKIKNANKNPFLLFFCIIGLERATVETWKIVRKEEPGKFSNGEWGNPKCCLCGGYH